MRFMSKQSNEKGIITRCHFPAIRKSKATRDLKATTANPPPLHDKYLNARRSSSILKKVVNKALVSYVTHITSHSSNSQVTHGAYMTDILTLGVLPPYSRRW